MDTPSTTEHDTNGPASTRYVESTEQLYEPSSCVKPALVVPADPLLIASADFNRRLDVYIHDYLQKKGHRDCAEVFRQARRLPKDRLKPRERFPSQVVSLTDLWYREGERG